MSRRRLIERIAALSQPLSPRLPAVGSRAREGGPLRAVLFDVYGTLFISGSGDIGTAAASNNAAAAGEAMLAAGVCSETELPCGEEVIRHFEAGIRTAQVSRKQRHPDVESPEVDIREVWKGVLQEVGLPSSETTCERVAVEYECRVNPVWPMPQALAAIQSVRDRGLPLGIVSNSQFYTPLLFPALLGAGTAELGFDEEISAWSYRLLESKPSPRLFEQALGGLARKYGIAPADTLYLGNDMRNDVWTASRAGCQTALFAGDRRSLRLRQEDPACAAVRPDAVLTRLDQLAGQLD